MFLLSLLCLGGFAQSSCAVNNFNQRVVYSNVGSYKAVQTYVPNHFVQQPLVIGIPVQNFGLDYYYSVGDELRDERIAELVAKKLAAQSQPVVNQAAPAPAPDERRSSQPSPVPATSAIDQQVLSIFNDNCVNCHQPGKSTPGVQLFNEDGSLYMNGDTSAEISRRWKIFDSVFGGDVASVMPKGGEKLSDEDVNVIRKWVRNGVN